MKRSELKRKKGLARARAPRQVPAWKVDDLPRRLFREATQRQRIFRQPGCRTNAKPQSHHVVYEQHAKRAGANPHDGRNGLRICPCCHYAHHQGSRRIPTLALPLDALEYAFDALGEAAIDYFRRYYDGADSDARLVRLVTP
jgi:hypothetical protein